MTKLRLFNYTYFNIFSNEFDTDLECPILVLCCREEDGKFHAIKVAGNHGIYRPHFFVADEENNRKILADLLKAKKILEWGEWDYPAIYDENEKVLVVYTQYPYQVKNVRKTFIHTYQADVNYEELFVMMLGLDQGYFEIPDGKDWIAAEEIIPLPESEHFFVEPRIMYFDIETNFINPQKKFDLDNQEIISIVVYDNYTNTYYRLEWGNYEAIREDNEFVKRKFIHKDIPYYSYQITKHLRSEKEMLKEFFELFKMHPDGLMGFNSHGGNRLKTYKSKSKRVWTNGFDEPVIYKRAKKLGLEKQMQQMSPLPIMKNIYGAYYGGYSRGAEKKFEVVIRGLTPLDFYIAEPMMTYTKEYTDFFGRGLDDYLRYFSNFHKVEHKGLTVAELKDVDLQKELYYNKIDVEGCLFLDKRFGFSRDIFETVVLGLIKGIDVLSATKIHNFLTLKESKDYCVYDTKSQPWYRITWQGWTEEKKDLYGTVMKKKNRAGGYNIEIKKGKKEYTVVFDFSGFYPTLAYSSNAGIDTLIQVEREFKNHFRDRKGKRWHKSQCIITPSAPFRKDKESIERKIWGKLLRIRDIYKKKKKKVSDEYNDPNHPIVRLYESKQYNLKQRFVNNKYGASGNDGYIAKNYAVYNVGPSSAQYCLRGLEKEYLPSINHEVYFGDSDSVGFDLKADNVEEAVKEADGLVKPINEFIDMFLKREFNIDENIVKIGWEKIASKFYGHAKKNYCMEVVAEDGKILPNPYVLYKGFELKKRNRSDITELVQKTYLKIAMDSDSEKERREEIIKFIRRIEEVFEKSLVKEEIRKGKSSITIIKKDFFDWTKICSRINIRKSLDEYDKSYINRRAAEMANEILAADYGERSHGFLGYLDSDGNHRLSPVIMFNKKDIRKLKKLGYRLDYGKHKQSFVIDKLNLLLEDIGTDYYSLLRSSRIKDVCVL